MNPRTRTIIESPFAGTSLALRQRNKLYLRACLRHSFSLGEAPFASHRLYTDALDDDDPRAREAGIEAGFAWAEVAEIWAFYTDLGWSGGMRAAEEEAQAWLRRAEGTSRRVTIRSLGGAWRDDYL